MHFNLGLGTPLPARPYVTWLIVMICSSFFLFRNSHTQQDFRFLRIAETPMIEVSKAYLPICLEKFTRSLCQSVIKKQIDTWEEIKSKGLVNKKKPSENPKTKTKDKKKLSAIEIKE